MNTDNTGVCVFLWLHFMLRPSRFLVLCCCTRMLRMYQDVINIVGATLDKVWFIASALEATNMICNIRLVPTTSPAEKFAVVLRFCSIVRQCSFDSATTYLVYRLLSYIAYVSRPSDPQSLERKRTG